MRGSDSAYQTELEPAASRVRPRPVRCDHNRAMHRFHSAQFRTLAEPRSRNVQHCRWEYVHRYSTRQYTGYSNTAEYSVFRCADTAYKNISEFINKQRINSVSANGRIELFFAPQHMHAAYGVAADVGMAGDHRHPCLWTRSIGATSHKALLRQPSLN